MKEYRVSVWYFLCAELMHVTSGWWDSKEKATREADFLFERVVPKGLYMVDVKTEERSI